MLNEIALNRPANTQQLVGALAQWADSRHPPTDWRQLRQMLVRTLDGDRPDLRVTPERVSTWLQYRLQEVGVLDEQERHENHGGRPPGTGRFRSPMEAVRELLPVYRAIRQELQDAGDPDPYVSYAAVGRRMDQPATTVRWWVKRYRTGWPPRWQPAWGAEP